MKLYLSSYFFGNNVQDLLSLMEMKSRVAIILNAGDSYGDEKRPIYLAKEVEKFKSFGHEAEELDLRDYFDGQHDIVTKLEQYNMLWIMGGNSFVLRRAMAQSRADKVITKLVKANKLIYAGFSAGSVVATPSLHGIELVDDPNSIPGGYSSEIIWDGLSLVDYSIAPHYKSDHPESKVVDSVVAYFESHNMSYRTITDGEAIVVDVP